VSQDSGTGGAGYLLRHGKPAGRSEGRSAVVRGSVGRRIAKQLQFTPSGGGLRKNGSAGLFGRRPDRSPAAMAGNGPHRGRDGGRFGPRKLSAAIGGISPAAGLRPVGRNGSQGRRRALQSAI